MLENNAPFVSVPDGATLCLQQLSDVFDGLDVTAPQFTLCDVDGDQAMDALVMVCIGADVYGYEIFDERDGCVYGYPAYYRALQDLKTDGTSVSSSGASDTGFGLLSFDETGLGFQPIAYCESTATGGVRYVAQGEEITEAAFQQLAQAQYAKPDQPWYDMVK